LLRAVADVEVMCVVGIDSVTFRVKLLSPFLLRVSTSRTCTARYRYNSLSVCLSVRQSLSVSVTRCYIVFTRLNRSPGVRPATQVSSALAETPFVSHMKQSLVVKENDISRLFW